MNDKNGHALQVNDVVTPDNDTSMVLRIDSFDGTICYCQCRNDIAGTMPPFKFLPAHLIFVSSP